MDMPVRLCWTVLFGVGAGRVRVQLPDTTSMDKIEELRERLKSGFVKVADYWELHRFLESLGGRFF